MKTINETFTEEEFQKLQSAKEQKSWHDFIMELADKNQTLRAKLAKKEGRI